MKEFRSLYRPLASLVALSCALAMPCAVSAQESAGEGTEVPPDPNETPTTPEDDLRVFEPSYFAQFAPRNALDMVSRIPGFSISDGGGGQRGLGQADQNVLVNGRRFSSKSESLRDQLSRIPAGDVVRIELVDGNTLDVPGLTGLVANVVYESSGASGQFRYTAGFRPYNTAPQLFGGEVSLTGSSGALRYTVSLANENQRFGADGPVVVTDAEGRLIEEQYSTFSGGFDNPKLATSFTYDFGPLTKLGLNLSYGEDFYYVDRSEDARLAAGFGRLQTGGQDENGPEYEIGLDFEFPLGPGTAKLIGLERFERDNSASFLRDDFDDGRDPRGSRFTQTNGIGERIARGEYSWAMFGADFQLAGEAAFNRLDRISSLALLAPTGEYERIDFVAGTGGVKEDRYETSLSASQKVTNTLSVQAIGAMEFSRIEQTGSAANSRSFKRPKGSLAATWKPQDDLDVSLTAARRVSQLSFGDFLASVSLDDDTENAGNNELVPYQYWALELEANKRIGAWGSLRFEARQGWYADFIDWFPLGPTGEARGNIGDASRLHLGVDATLRMDPIGWTGARFDIRGRKRFMSVTDPFTGEDRAFSRDTIDLIDIDFRHDIAQSDWAYGASLFSSENAPYSRRYEVGRDWEGPAFASLFVEHKDVAGMTVQAQAGNLLGARNRFERTVFRSPRPDGEIAFNENRDRRIGPNFNVTLKGGF